MMRWLFLSVALLAYNPVSAQVRIAPRGTGALQEAYHLERTGRDAEAREIYRSILAANPRHSQAYSSLKNSLIRANLLEEAARVISSYIAAVPNDLDAQIELGEIYYRLDRKTVALETWRDLEKRFTTNQNYYRILVNTLAQLSLNTEIDSVAQRARQRFDDPSFLALELANYFATRGSVNRAVDEYINHLLVHPQQMKYVTDRILLLSDKPENQPFIEEQLQARLLDNDILVRLVLADFYFKSEHYDQCLQQHELLGLVTNDDLQRWLDLADGLLTERQYSQSITAFQTILQSGLRDQMPTRVMGEALLGIGRAFEQQIVTDDSNQSLVSFFPDNSIFEDHFYGTPEIDTDHLQASYRLYDSILVELPSSTYLAQAHYRLGEIKYRITRDFDGALQSYYSALKANPNTAMTRQLELRIGDVLLAQGKFDQALDHFLGQMQSKLDNAEISPFLIRLIQTNLLSGDVESALTLCETSLQTAQPSNPYYNDLMEIQDLIVTYYQEGSAEDKVAFVRFLMAEAAVRQNKLSEGLEILLDLQNNITGLPLYHLVTLHGALLARTLQQTDLALQLAGQLIGSGLADSGLVLRGEIYEYQLNDPHRALDSYHNLLENYPRSLLLEPVRYHIRTLNAQLGS